MNRQLKRESSKDKKKKKGVLYTAEVHSPGRKQLCCLFVGRRLH